MNLLIRNLLLILILVYISSIFYSCQKRNDLNESFTFSSSEKVYNVSKSELQSMYDKYVKTGILPKKISREKILTKSVNDPITTDQQAMDELISDNFISSILNDSYEIIVEGILYKITPYGTFFGEEYRRGDLNALVEQIAFNNPIESLDLENVDLDLSMYNVTIDNDSEVIRFSNGISYIKTFSADEVNNFLGNGDVSGTIPNYASPIDNDPIFLPQNMISSQISNQNGSLFKTIFVNSTDYNYFDNQYRTSVLFYNRNYGIIKTIGVKVKQQKKGTFWWNKISAEEIVAGWKYLVYNSSMKIPKPSFPKAVYSVKAGNTSSILLPLEENSFNSYLEQYQGAAINYIMKTLWAQVRSFAIGSGPNVGKISVINSDGTTSLMTAEEVLQKHNGFVVYDWNGVDTEGNVKFILASKYERYNNTSLIDIPLDFEILVSSSPVTTIQTIFSSIKIESAYVFGSSRRGNTWKGIIVN